MHQTSLAFLAARQIFSWVGIDETGWKEETQRKGDVHVLSNCDTICSHICTIGYLCPKNWWPGTTHGSRTHSCVHLFSAPAATPNPSCWKSLMVIAAQLQQQLLQTTREKLGQLLGLGLYFLPCSWRWLSSLATAETQPVMTITLCVLLGTLLGGFFGEAGYQGSEVWK